MVKVLQTVTMASGVPGVGDQERLVRSTKANAWQDRQVFFALLVVLRQAGDFSPFWQQQLQETQPWFAENQLNDATPEEAILGNS